MKLFKLFSKRKNKASKKNNEGMTLVEVLVSITLFAMMAGMILAASNFSCRTQADTDEWNVQSDNQAEYLSRKRAAAVVDADKTPTGIDFSGGKTAYNLKIVSGSETYDTGASVSVYSVNTQVEQNEDGNNIPTNDSIHLKFFRVD